MEDMHLEKKVYFVGLFALLFASLMFSFASAASKSIVSDIKSIGSGAYEIVRPLAEALLGSASTGEILFAKVLFAVLFLLIVYNVISKISVFANSKFISWVISAGVSILAIRFIAESWLYAILLPYTTLGVVLTAGLPFVIFFFLVNVGMKDQPGIVRRVAWIFFTVVFIGLWVARYDALPAGEEGALYIYPVTALLALIMAWMDGTVSRFFARVKVEKQMGDVKYERYLKLLKEYEELNRDLSDAKVIGDQERVNRIAGQLGRLHITLAKLEGR